MKHFNLLRLSVLVLGAAASLVLTPSCKAQSEISPDHFDGTDSWATSARKVHVQSQKQAVAKPTLQAKGLKETKGSGFQLAAAREVSKPVNRQTVAVERKRKPAASNSDKP